MARARLTPRFTPSARVDEISQDDSHYCLTIPAGKADSYRLAQLDDYKSEEGYSVSVPGLPGCWSQGATEAVAIENIREAIRDYLAVGEQALTGEDVREIEVTG